MSELKNLSAILEGGAVPASYNGKAIGKLSKTYLKLEKPQSSKPLSHQNRDARRQPLLPVCLPVERD